ncbi:MAG: putative selenium-dependent hydroxylase accessory protein YqeC [Desulfarculaceae bacterium]|nr:putative selenium-dependent hydroxylase accessory protein YqeC [Desulfarculaceae bacterium]MCF8073434.1 putative selenium-dependent hydroxylase accessory protein YqeC [Desulfarculaceae bacterium]MCF8100419.1 putative selenium-dependent hydroxylase accessory protein YqeC [Desulfarculaceae bacterium]MCF8115845.1 putative selenium-dependent hydroxylase accessory protein YqeC [Desulfarculaceae bacterium]
MVAGVVLAAGLSTRFGGDKLSAPLAGRPLAHWALEAALCSSLGEVILVTRPELADDLGRAFPAAHLVVNQNPARGQSGSLRLGLEAASPKASHALFLLADQPLITPALIDSFVAAALTGHGLAALDGLERIMPPTLFAREHFSELLRAKGDKGGRQLLAAHGEEVLTLPPNFPLAGMDVDQPRDLGRAELALLGGLHRALGLKARELVSVVGAGGKTSLVHALASEAALDGRAVLVATSTKVFVPAGRLLVKQEPEAMLTQAAERTLPGWVLNMAADRRMIHGASKLIGLEPLLLDRLFTEETAPLILVEADGARRLSIKAPRSHEPVIPSASTTVVGVMGLSALGKPADEDHVYGLDEFLAITQANPDEPLVPEHLAALSLHDQGLFKGAPDGARRVVCLNQSDGPGARHGGREIAELIQARDSSMRIVLASLESGEAEVLKQT